MALIRCTASQNRFYVKDYHRFGRLTGSVDTLINSPAITKVHAVIEWEALRWQIRDQSKNGTWLNNIKLKTGESYPLKVSDTISFCNTGDYIYRIEDISPPQSLLIPSHCNDQTCKAVSLNNYNLLPDEESPSVALYFSELKQQWFIENINAQLAPKPVFNGEQILIDQQNWQLQLYNRIDDTQLLEHHDIEQLRFHFEVSLDEEDTHLKLQTPDRTVDFQVRIHHYLTLHLARVKAQHAQQGIDGASQGWMDMEVLSKEMGMDNNHLNILIHRARKQFTDQVKQVDNADRLFERQSGKIRFGGEHFDIYKGTSLECRFPAGAMCGL